MKLHPRPCPLHCVVALAWLALHGAPAGADEAPVPDGQWRGTLGAALSATSGNTSSSALLLNGDAARLTVADKISVGGNINYARAEIDGQRTTTANKLDGFGQYDRNIDTRLFGFGKLSFARDRVNHLSLRSALDGGLGYKLVDTQALHFTVFAGGGYASDRYDSAQTIAGRTDTRFARASVFLAEESGHQLTPTVTAKQRLEWNGGISGDNAQLLKLTAGLGVAMSPAMNLTVGLVDTYNSRPPEGQQGNDVSLFTGVNVKFGGS